MPDVPIHVAEPEGAPRGGVIVIQEAFGVTDHIRSVTDRVAAAGYVACAPALFHRVSSPPPEIEYDISKVMPVMGTLKADEILADVDAALDLLGARGIDHAHCGIVGFCMGGTVALAVGANRAIGAAVSFYGGGVAQGRFGFPSLIELAPSLQTPWLGLYGDEDTGIPVEQVEELRTAAAKASVPTELVRYAGAQHAFHNDDRRDVYDETAAADAWSRTLTFFAEQLG